MHHYIQEAVEVISKDLLARSAPNIVVGLSVIWFLVFVLVVVASLALKLHLPFPHIFLAVLLQWALWQAWLAQLYRCHHLQSPHSSSFTISDQFLGELLAEGNFVSFIALSHHVSDPTLTGAAASQHERQEWCAAKGNAEKEGCVLGPSSPVTLGRRGNEAWGWVTSLQFSFPCELSSWCSVLRPSAPSLPVQGLHGRAALRVPLGAGALLPCECPAMVMWLSTGKAEVDPGLLGSKNVTPLRCSQAPYEASVCCSKSTCKACVDLWPSDSPLWLSSKPETISDVVSLGTCIAVTGYRVQLWILMSPFRSQWHHHLTEQTHSDGVYYTADI